MIQNEMVKILKKIILEKVVFDSDASDVNGFHFKSDFTRDPTNVKNVSVTIRFVKEGKVH